MKIFSSIRKYVHLSLKCILIVHHCLSLYLSLFFKEIFSFKNYLMLSSILFICYTKIFSFIQKCLYILFHVYSSFICMPIIVCEIFLRKSSISSVILCNPQFYHTYIKWISAVLYKNVSSSLFNNTLFVFVCLSL